MTIKIQDNFLSPQDFEYVRDSLMSDQMVWHYNDYSVGGGYDTGNLPQFIHNFIKIENGHGGIVSSQYIDAVVPLLNNIPNLCTVIRCKANLTLGHDEPVESGMHVDTEKSFDGFTSVFYLNDTDGGTVFETGEIVECKANRLLTFDNRIKHSGITCTNQRRRVVVNLNYTVWSE